MNRPMPSEFAHLHVHSQYSMLDGALKVKSLVKSVAAMGMRAVALTDHGNMFGAITFYKAAKDAGVTPLLGCELNVMHRGKPLHLPVLAASHKGYQNLTALVSEGYVQPAEGAPSGLPAITLESLAKRSSGLVVLSGCMGGLLAQDILEEGEERGRQMLGELVEVVEKGAFYVELQDHGLPEQPVLNDILTRLARSQDLPLVATNDVHYPRREDSEAHIYLSCIKSGRPYGDAKATHHGSSEMYLKTPDEMYALFGSRAPSALANTLEIAERCAIKLKLGEPMLPNFQVPDGYDTEGYFRHVAHEGLRERFAEFALSGKKVDEAAYTARLVLELDVICKMKFPGYFLIVWDFIRYGKQAGVPVGPGRGSGAGSLVAYALRITDLDPLPYNLLFERFLNPERVSMPDFDVDFCMDKRDQVIAYVQQKYGENSVGQIATFAELKSKSTVKDVGRCLSITPVEAQLIANLIPRKTPAETYTIGESLGIEPKLRARYETEPVVRELLDQAQKLEGLTRHAGKHAAGIVISEGPLWDHVPVFRDEKTGSLVTQYYKDDVEQAGLVKFDFLGLKTLTVIDIAVSLIRARPDQMALPDDEKFRLERIRLDDKATYQLLSSGETKGVFQLESSGMQKLFKDLRADCFEDIVAAVALYRPGPLGTGMVEDFVNRKHGRAPVAKMHDLVDHILAPTYGVIVYQEQVMQIAQALAGYSLGGADLLRRAMGKKKPEEMAKQKSTFVDGAKGLGVDVADAERIFALLEYFAGYGFNKSHSAAYALITYQTAYLKAHYPVELLCSIMTSDKDKIEKVVRTIADARAMGITVLPPDVNESDRDFRVVYTHPDGSRKASRKERVSDPFGPQIRFGLGAVRGLGESALEALFEARRAGGPFHDLFEFASRIDAKRVNKAVFEALIQCGAFDTTNARAGVSRARAFASIDTALERARSASRDRECGQTSLFGLFDAGPAKGALLSSQGDFAECVAWDQRETLVRERQSLGFYVSGHPILRYVRNEAALGRLGATACSECNGKSDWEPVRVLGMVEGYRERIFKDGGGKVAFFEVEDLSGRVQVKLRGKDIEAYGPVLTRGEPVVVSGKISFPQKSDDAPDDEEEGPREATILLSEARLLSEVVRADVRAVTLRLSADKHTKGQLDELRKVALAAKGSCPLTLRIDLPNGAAAILGVHPDHRVEASDTLFAGIERIFGEQLVDLS